MITFKQYLSEKEETLADVIQEFCGPYLKESERNGVLLRGITNIGAPHGEANVDGRKTPYWIKKVRKDRAPKSTPPDVQVVLDEWFEAKFGWKARAEGMFCVGYPGQNTAQQYGDSLCLVFPMNEFKYVWSEETEDLWDNILDVAMDTPGGFYEMENNIVIKKDGKRIVKRDLLHKYLDKLDYRNDGLDEAVESNKEIMVGCDYYIAVRHEEGWYDLAKQLRLV